LPPLTTLSAAPSSPALLFLFAAISELSLPACVVNALATATLASTIPYCLLVQPWCSARRNVRTSEKTADGAWFAMGQRVAFPGARNQGRRQVGCRSIVGRRRVPNRHIEPANRRQTIAGRRAIDRPVRSGKHGVLIRTSGDGRLS
jgi:hypothetical protein